MRLADCAKLIFGCQSESGNDLKSKVMHASNKAQFGDFLSYTLNKHHSKMCIT